MADHWRSGLSFFFFFFLLSIAQRNGSKSPPPDVKVLSFVHDVRNFEMTPYRKTITRKAHSNHLSPRSRRTSHHVLSSSHHCIFQYLSCRTNLTMVCNVFLISTRLMRVCLTLVAGLSSRPPHGRAHPRPSPARVENAAHPKSATGATSSTKLRVCYAALPTSVWPHVRSIHVPWSISPVQENTHRSLLSGYITRPSIQRWRPPWISEFFNNAEANFALHIEEALAFQHHRPQFNRRDEDMGTGFLIWSALCCLSRSRSCSRYLCADNVAIYLHFSVQLISYSFAFSWTLPSFFRFFLRSFRSPEPLPPELGKGSPRKFAHAYHDLFLVMHGFLTQIFSAAFFHKLTMA